MDTNDNFKQRLDAYLAENFVEEDFVEEEDFIEPPKIFSARKISSPIARKFTHDEPIKGFGLVAAHNFIDFKGIFERNEGETFSEMLMRLIKESGEKIPDIYTKAQIDCKHFSKIKNRKDYQPSRDTAIALAMALKLDFEKAKELIATAGYSLSKSKRDLIITFFIQNKIFDTFLLNDCFYEYGQRLLFEKQH